MPNVNLSTLSGPELRRLLDSARQRGEAALSYRILQEMEARREHGDRRGLFALLRPAEPRTVAVNLGDPMARDDVDDVPPMPFWRAPSQVAEVAPDPEPQPPPPEPAPRRSRRRNTQAEPASMRIEAAFEEPTPAPEPEPPLSLRFTDPEPSDDAADGAEDWNLHMHPPGMQKAGPPRGLRRGLAAGFALGIAAGAGLGWWVWGSAPREPAVAAPTVAPIQTAALAPPAAPPVLPVAAEPAPVPEAQPEPAVAPSPDPVEAVPAPSEVPQVAREAEAEPAESPPAHHAVEAVRTAEATAPAPNGCAAQPTPADRTICGDPELRGLQRQLRQAYNEALEAHEDRALLRQRQLAWASARDPVTDSDRLARLYEERIRKLNAATAAARSQH